VEQLTKMRQLAFSEHDAVYLAPRRCAEAVCTKE